MQVNVHEAKTQLSKLLQLAEAGEEVIIARNGKPSVRLAPVRAQEKKPNFIFGLFPGEVHVADWTEQELDEMFFNSDEDEYYR